MHSSAVGWKAECNLEMSKPEANWSHLFFVVLTLVVMAGCDGRPARVPVSGQVLLDGKPLSYGQVLFIPDIGRQSTGTLDTEGKFTMTCLQPNDGVIVGNLAIAVLSGEPKSATKTYWHAPPKYADPKTSEITKNITEDTKNLLIELTWKDNPPGHPFLEVQKAEEEGDLASPSSRRKSSSK
jgi:hypothetical protein